MRSCSLWHLVCLCSIGACLASPATGGQQKRLSAVSSPSTLAILSPTLTSKWFEGSDYVQVIEMVIRNTDANNPLTLADNFVVTASSAAVDLVHNATVKRLMPGQETAVQIGVRNKASTAKGSSCSVNLSATWGTSSSTSAVVNGNCGFGDYVASTASLGHHWTPDWYNKAKFGIFIHWGIYSVPAFGNAPGPKQDYAEWYWKRQHEPNYRSQTYQYHLETYGPDVEYDDFIANFTAEKFHAKEWIDLFADAGARYVVPVTKHHDGYAIFNTPPASSLRNSVKLGPKRDFLRELFSAVDRYHPELRKGTYFSLPEWYHPQYAAYNITWGGGFPGGPPTNPYKNITVPYTGYVNVSEFVTQVQVPQMESIAYDYGTEIMWCDIGNANNSTIVMSKWFNWARDHGRQVVFNDRCGIPGDFSTPEYWQHDDIVVSKWESNRGMDPFSFGYNYLTPDEDYLTGQDVVTTLVDIVSKNGNFLLDVGPKADGTIPDIMQKGLRDAGRWIKSHGEAIFNTRFWSQGPGKDPLRYTMTDDAFYVLVNSKPGSTLAIPDKIPLLDGDRVVVVGGTAAGIQVPATKNTNGSVVLDLSDDVIAGDEYVWVFKIEYGS